MAPKSKTPITVVKIPTVKSWKFGTIEHVDGGKRFIPISLENGNNLNLSLNNVHCPFNLSDYDQGNRKTLVLQFQPELESPLDCMTECLIFEAAQKSEFFFGEILSEDKLRSMYKNIVRKKEKYPSNLAAKIITAGYNKTRFWHTSSRARVDSPEDFQGLDVNAMLHVKGLYITPESWGLIVNITDLQLLSSTTECPF